MWGLTLQHTTPVKAPSLKSLKGNSSVSYNATDLLDLASRTYLLERLALNAQSVTHRDYTLATIATYIDGDIPLAVSL